MKICLYTSSIATVLQYFQSEDPLNHPFERPSAGACFKGGGDGGHGSVTPEGSRHFGAGEKTGGGAKGMMLDNPASMYNMILHYRYIYTYNIL